ncbi:MAG: DUF2520 domain-containing protein [Anaerolineaceae bacterium]|nr:DUF2520 domain-containing protein [Anaerolineaceae bacterium]
MGDPELPSVGIIGAGKVGSTLARLWHQAGCRVVAVYSRSEERAGALATRVEAAVCCDSPDHVLQTADLTILAVPDDVIEQVAGRLTTTDLRGKGVVHTSGVHDAGSLSTLAARGALVGSLHPAFPFANIETAVANLPGAAFAVEAESPRLRDWLVALVSRLDGQVMVIPPGKKAVYHAALVIASNYAVTLYNLAEGLLTDLGADVETADRALNPLVGATARNLIRQGVPAALTGPLVRGDAGTVRLHLDALRALDVDLAALYVQLARLTLPMLAARGVESDAIERVLGLE